MGAFSPGLTTYFYPAWQQFQKQQKEDEMWNRQKELWNMQDEQWKMQQEEWRRKEQLQQQQQQLEQAQRVGIQLYPLFSTIKGAEDPNQKVVRGKLLANYLSLLTGKPYEFIPTQPLQPYILQNKENPQEKIQLDRPQIIKMLLPTVGKFYPSSKLWVTPQRFIITDDNGNPVKEVLKTPLEAFNDPNLGKRMFSADTFYKMYQEKMKEQNQKSKDFITMQGRDGNLVAIPRDINAINEAYSKGLIPYEKKPIKKEDSTTIAKYSTYADKVLKSWIVPQKKTDIEGNVSTTYFIGTATGSKEISPNDYAALKGIVTGTLIRHKGEQPEDLFRRLEAIKNIYFSLKDKIPPGKEKEFYLTLVSFKDSKDLQVKLAKLFSNKKTENK